MTVKDIKEEARKKLALNIHQAIVIYLVEFTVFITLIALVVMSCVSLGAVTPAAIVMICYGALLGLLAIVGSGMVNFAMCDFYLATYRCKPYNIRRLGDTLARSGVTKILLISLKRTLLAFLLTLCLIVPGVIYIIRTSMANYLLIANPKMKASTALSASNKVMSGKTGAYFALCMSLVGWYLLGLITLGLCFVFIIPYTNLIKATYYKRNLQGDRNVYQIAVQPITPQSAPPQPNYAATSEQAQRQELTAQPVAAEAVGSPIDTLADEDVVDMNAAMHDFDEPQTPVADVKEVPISPITQNRKSSESATAVPTLEPVLQASDSVEPFIEPVIAAAPQAESANAQTAHELDGTNIVETERILTTQEINESKAIREQAIESIYSRSDSRKSDKDYFTGAGAQNADDFFVDDFGAPTEQEEQPVQSETPFVNPTDGVAADPIENSVMSDSEFDEFLRGFDSATEAQSDFEPLKRNENANTNREGIPPRASDGDRRPPERHAATERAVADRRVPRRNSDNAGKVVNDRTERIRREREERLNLNNKK